MILGYLEYDPYTILSLTLVSKHFLSNLGINSNEPEKDWERRCKLLEGGRNKKSPGYKTWRETYIQIIKKKCAICHKNTKAKLGKLYDNNINGPKIIVVCEPCQQIQDTPYSVISTKAIDIVIKEYPIPWLKGITFKMRKINDQFWLKEHLFNTVVKIYANELIKTSLEVNGLNEVNEEKKEITLQIAREIATKILKRAMEIYRLETGPIAF